MIKEKRLGEMQLAILAKEAGIDPAQLMNECVSIVASIGVGTIQQGNPCVWVLAGMGGTAKVTVTFEETPKQEH